MVKRAPLRAKQPEKAGKKQKREEGGEVAEEEESHEESSQEDEVDQADDEKNDSDAKKESFDSFTFEFNDFNESFQDGIQLLIKEFVKSPYSWSVTEALAEQGEVGTLVHCEGESDVFALATVMPLSELQKLEECEPLSKSLKKILQGFTTSSKDEFAVSKIGWFINSRFANLPAQLHGELHHNLKEDLQWVGKQNVNQKGAEFDVDIVKAFQQMTHFLYLAPCTPQHSAIEQLGSKDSVALADYSEVDYKNSEDELFCKHARQSLLVKLDQAVFACQYAVSMVLPKKSYDKVVEDIAENSTNLA
eukprot:gene37708-45810_t